MDELFYTLDADVRHDELVDAAQTSGARLRPVTDEALAVLAETVTPQGLVAVCRFLDRRLPVEAKLIAVLHGITDPARLAERVPTVCCTHARLAPSEAGRWLAAEGIYVWHGNYYALPLTEALGLEPEGAIRVGLLHYNTADEVDRLLGALG